MRKAAAKSIRRFAIWIVAWPTVPVIHLAVQLIALAGWLDNLPYDGDRPNDRHPS